jgi:hypothetical protein
MTGSWRTGARRWLSLTLYLGTFVGARGALFAAPLILASLLAAADYGRLESALAAATLMASIATLGTSSLVPMVLHATGTVATRPAIDLHHLLVVGACTAVAMLALGLSADAVWQTASLTAAVALQGLASIDLKSAGRSNGSLLIDAMLMLAMVFGVAAWRLVEPVQALGGAWAATATVAAALAWRLARRCRDDGVTDFRDWCRTLGQGVPLMLTGMVGALVSSSGRLGMGWLAEGAAVGAYAVLSRGAALPIVAHQIVLVARFRDVFVLQGRQLESTLIKVLACVAVSAVALWCIVPWVGALLGPAFHRQATLYRVEFAWLLAQSVLWSAVALNDLVNSKRGSSARVLMYSLPALLLLIPAGWFLVQRLGIAMAVFVRVHGVLLLVFYLIQCGAMAVNGVRMWRVWLVAVIGWLVLPLATAGVRALPSLTT